jgi:L-ascorbate metabolism protein UlaG (beta-lactamase superfamily)
MGLKVTFLGHAGFLLESEGHRVAVDPFLSGNELARHKAEDIQCETICFTHGHEDHLNDDGVAIAKNNGAQVISSYEICMNFFSGQQGLQNVNPGNPGGQVETDFGWVAFTQAFHSSSYQGQYMGMPMGLVIHMHGTTFYHLGDTGLFSDLELIGELYRPHIAAVPVGDRFTMGPKLATRAAEMIGAEVAIPIHYKTFGLLGQDIQGFEPKGVEVKELAPGEAWQYGG